MPETGDARTQVQNVAAIALQDRFNQGMALHQQGRLAEAERIYREVLRQQPNHFDALHLLGVIALQLRQPEQAADLIGRAIGLNANVAAAHSNLGRALLYLKRSEEALASCDKALALKPNFAEAYYNRGNALNALQRPEEALASYNEVVALNPDLAAAHNDRGLTLNKLRRFEEALASYDKAIALKPNFVEAHNNRGIALKNLNRHEEALASYDKAVALKPDFAEAYNNRGVALKNLNRHEEALASYNKAIALKPNFEFLYGVWLHAKMTICDWSNLDSEVAALVEKIKRAENASLPFPILSISGSPELQRHVAEIWTRAKYLPNKTLPTTSKHPRRYKICIGYFSADFYDHATARLMAELFEKHDRTRFELIAFSFGPDENDEVRQRLSAAFDKFIDVRNLSDSEVALLARKLEIDIAVDLNGFTAQNRTGIFACRAAPVQVSYLGYPGTMGANYIDYLIADSILIQESDQPYYTEKIVYLPNSYQANDSKRHIVNKVLPRANFGLPDNAFVFCCFNNNYKIAPDVFDCWMRILRQIEGSVLWLLEDNASAASNLRREAGVRGVNPERLLFAQRMSLPEHLARHRLADLFVDTLPYNAHTTASDALWVGLPVLTRIGETFAGRVAASLLTAVGLPELITSTPQAYEDLAIELASNPEKLAAIKHKLANDRLTAPLFDTQLLTRHIEAAYAAMYERYQADLPPDHIYVPQ